MSKFHECAPPKYFGSFAHTGQVYGCPDCLTLWVRRLGPDHMWEWAEYEPPAPDLRESKG